MNHETVNRVAWAIYDAISYIDVLKGDLSDGYIVAIDGKVDFEACARAAIIAEANEGGLKPCPFCGGEAATDSRICLGFVHHFAQCGRCTAQSKIGPNKEAAIAAWNRRAPA